MLVDVIIYFLATIQQNLIPPEHIYCTYNLRKRVQNLTLAQV